MSLKRMKLVRLIFNKIHTLVTEYAAKDGTDGDRKENLRSKPLSGTLQVTLKSARELDHAPIITSGRSRSASKHVVETQVSLKVEGTQLARSHPSRTDRWNEDFEITVDKANEVEIVVYDKQVGEMHAVPIGLLWIRISDLVEALRRQKVVMESGHGGWVTAGAMPGDSPTGGPMHPASGDMNAPLSFDNPGAPPGASGVAFPNQADGIDAWFAVEPAGAVALHLNFSTYFLLNMRLCLQYCLQQSKRMYASAPWMPL